MNRFEGAVLSALVDFEKGSKGEVIIYRRWDGKGWTVKETAGMATRHTLKEALGDRAAIVLTARGLSDLVSCVRSVANSIGLARAAELRGDVMPVGVNDGKGGKGL